MSGLVTKNQPVETVWALDLCIQVARGLAAAHDKQVVHQDLKPDNLMVARDGRVVITDFGVAVLRSDPKLDVLPMRGAGTPRYMAPEQIEGRGICEKTDLYGLGGGQINEAWSALRAAATHAVDAAWFTRCPALARMNRVPAFQSLRSQVAARAARVFQTDAPAPR